MIALLPMRKWPLILALSLGSLLAVLWTWRMHAAAGTHQTIRFAYVGSSEDARHRSALLFKEIVESDPACDLRVELYYGGQLGGDRDAIEGVRLGTLEMTVAGAGIFTNFHPPMGVTALPFLFDDFATAWSFCDGLAYRRVTDQLLRQGLRVLGHWDNGFRCITNSVRPVHRPEELRGLKIRTPENPIILATFRAIDAAPSPLPWTELYMALQQGAFDGQENSLPIIHANKLYEIQQHLSLTNHIYEPMPVAVSEYFWKGLDGRQRALVQRAVSASQAHNRALIKEMSNALPAELQALGMTITRPDRDAFKSRTASVHQEFAAAIGPDLIEKAYQFKR